MLSEANFDLLVFLITFVVGIIFFFTSAWKKQLRTWLPMVFFTVVGSFLFLFSPTASFLTYSFSILLMIVSAFLDFAHIFEFDPKKRNLIIIILFFSPLFSLIPIISIFLQLHLVMLALLIIAFLLYIKVYLNKRTPTHLFIMLFIMGAFLSTFTSYISLIFKIQLLWDLSYIINFIFLTFLSGTAIVAYPEDRIIKSEEKYLRAYDHAKREVRERTEELIRSNTELEQFAYVVSHDLQEPLRMVASFTQLLQNRYRDKLDDEANEFINFAVDGATRMQGLIKDLLTFSRIRTKTLMFSPIDMNIVLENVLVNILQSTVEAGAEITYDTLPILIADGSQMMQILQNLISNALKFRGKNQIHIHVSGEEKPDEWIFSVRDNGIGIDSKNFERIFVIFQRLHKRDEYEGTGIGLAVCKRIIERYDGKIWVESELGKGSTFYFSIPKTEVRS